MAPDSSPLSAGTARHGPYALYRLRSFSLRWLSPREYLGLHLTLGLLLTLVALVAFILTARSVVGEGRLTDFDRACAEALKEHAEKHPALLAVLRVVTRT